MGRLTTLVLGGLFAVAVAGCAQDKMMKDEQMAKDDMMKKEEMMKKDKMK